MLRGAAAKYEEFHGVRYTDKALRAAAELSARYLADRKLPDKAIDLIDEAGRRQAEARKRRTSRSATSSRASARKEIEAVVATMARIPPKRVAADDRERLKNLEGELRRRSSGRTRRSSGWPRPST